MKKIQYFCLLILFSCGVIAEEKPNTPVSLPVVGVGEVTMANDQERRFYTGQVSSITTVNIAPRISGELIAANFRDGKPVKKGQLLYRFERTQYEAAVKNAQARVAECKARLTYARRSFDRNNLLYDKQAVSLDVMENTKATLEADQASLLAAEAELITAQDNLKYTELYSPMDGIAGVGAFSEGNYITPNSGTLVTIVQIQPIRVRFAISTADYLAMFGSPEALEKNARVRLQLADGSDFPEEGRIEILNNAANPRTDTIQVYARFPNASRRLIPDSMVSVTLLNRTEKSFPAVSTTAVMHDSQGSYVYVLARENKVEKRYIVPGNSTGALQLIRSGVNVGETVIVKGTHKAAPGAVVEPVTQSRES